MSYDEAVGLAIRAARTRAGLTLQEVAEKVGLSESGLSRAETGRTQTNIVKLRKLSRVLGVAASAIVQHADELMAAGQPPPT
jgi:transcriptional regulator with XRE-family HTH domain